MTVKRVLIFVAAVALVLAVANHPQQYATAGKGAGNKIMQIADGWGEFLGALVS